MKHRSNYNKFLLLWSGELVSAIGSGLTSFGLGVYVFQKTGSAANMALVALLAFLPVLLLSAPAGFLLTLGDVKHLLMIDISTFFLTVLYTAVVRKGISAKPADTEGTFMDSFREGWRTIHEKRGVMILIIVSGVLLAAAAAALYQSKDVRKLEEQSAGETYEQTDDNQ